MTAGKSPDDSCSQNISSQDVDPEEPGGGPPESVPEKAEELG